MSRQTDIYAVGVMLWELVTGERLFFGDNEGVVVAKILEGHVEPPSAVLKRTRRESVPEEALAAIEQLDATILRALSTQAEARFANAREMALELERKCPPTTSFKCGEWVEDIARDVLSSRAALVAEVESSASMTIEGHDSVLSVLDASSSVRATALRSAEITPALVTPTTGPHLPTASRMLAPPIEGAPRPSSSIPASAGSFAEPRQRGELGGRAAIVIAVIAVLLGASMLAGALAYRRTKQDEASDPGAAEPPALPAVVTSSRAVEPTTSAPTATPPTTTSAASAATAGDAGSAAIGSGPGSTATATRGATGSSPKVVKSGAGTKVGGKSAAETDDCTTPYYYDSAQVKHYKPRCLGDK